VERKTLARWLVVAALACFGLLWLAGSALAQENVVQGSNASDTSTADTGNVDGTNTSTFSGGPTATGGTGASAQQLGHNSATVHQSGSAKTGDPVAGAQVTGAVADNVTVQNSNAAIDPSATSGTATFENFADVTAGPVATTDDGVAQASQFGDNSTEIAQAGIAESGDAVGGSQVTGIVGDGIHTVQNQNACDCTGSEILSGDAEVLNESFSSAGPFAFTLGAFTAQTGQVGDNDAVLSQAAEVTTGDALLASQVTGIVGGSAIVQNSNAAVSGGVEATSGNADASNTAASNGNEAIAGPEAISDAGFSQVSQTGDNSVDATQETAASSGDALNGAQVTGAVGDEGGFLTVQNQQASEDPASTTGSVSSENDLVGNAGPTTEGATGSQGSQNGDNEMAIEQSADNTTGDAVAGSQVTGAVGYHDVIVNNSNASIGAIALSGDDASTIVNNADVEVGVDVDTLSGFANASQLGDNSASADQTVSSATGDAVAGGQVTGVVASGSTITVANSNAAIDSFATSGDGLADTANLFIADVGPDAEGADLSASAQQTGDNSVVASQAAVIGTGDAVAGSQVTGAVADDNAIVTVLNQNASDVSEAITGTIDNAVINDFVPAVGPAAATFGTAALVSQNGDNTIESDQAFDASTGDAVSSAQVTGAVTGDNSTVTIATSNAATGVPLALTGDILIDVGNNVDAQNGPFADGLTSGSAQQLGDNSVTADQAAIIATGDAVAGAQVAGAVAGDGSDVIVAAQNAADGSISTSGTVDVGDANFFGALNGGFGPEAIGDIAQASQFGDNSVDVSQTAAATSGDAVGGAQVAGVVAGDDSNVVVMESNACTSAPCAEVNTGDVTFGEGNELGLIGVGPTATSFFGSASASQFGDNSVSFDQTLAASSGDAVAGSQVTGVVTGDDSDTVISNQNSSDTALATTGIVDAANFSDTFTVGPFADATGGTAQAQQTGDNSLDFSQDLTGTSGDAVAGSQVTGQVGGEAVIQVANADLFSEATSGDTTLDNDASGSLTATAISDLNAQVSQNGDTAFEGAQDLNPTTGDAVSGAQVGGKVG